MIPMLRVFSRGKALGIVVVVRVRVCAGRRAGRRQKKGPGGPTHSVLLGPRCVAMCVVVSMAVARLARGALASERAHMQAQTAMIAARREARYQR